MGEVKERTMKAFELQNNFGLENLKLIERPEPKIQNSNDVLIKIKATSLNFRDYLVVTGKYNPKFKLPFVGVDVMKIFALNKAGSYNDSQTGEKKYIPKGLKQTSINLQWFELLEYELPPICEKDAELYYDNLKKYCLNH